MVEVVTLDSPLSEQRPFIRLVLLRKQNSYGEIARIRMITSGTTWFINHTTDFLVPEKKMLMGKLSTRKSYLSFHWKQFVHECFKITVDNSHTLAKVCFSQANVTHGGFYYIRQ
jgi:hypothetical protein